MAASHHYQYDRDYEPESPPYVGSGDRPLPLHSSRMRPYDPSQPRMPPSPNSATYGPPYSHQNPSLPTSPRWDSLHHGSQGFSSPTSARFPLYAHDSHFEPQAHHVPPGPSSPFDATTLRPDSRQGRHTPPRPLNGKSSLHDLRASDASFISNFSRPRTKSLRQQQQPELPRSPHSRQLPPLDFSRGMPIEPPPPSPAWGRPRLPSDASHLSSSTFASAYPPSNESRSSSRMRNASHPHPPGPRPPFGNQRVDSSASAPTFSGAAPWLSGDEHRSSFRSHHTMSTGPGTTVTERSSVLTKDTSVTSLDTDPHEPSLEDVMGMYEKGFADDDDDSEQVNARPFTPASDHPARQELMDDLPRNDDARMHKNSALDSEIRQSKMFFTSLAYTSSVPHIASKYETNLDDDDDDDERSKDKRDSGKSLESDPSLKSDSAAIHSSPPQYPVASSPPPAPVSEPIHEPVPAPAPARTPAPSLPVETEEPGSRDRYGFKKQNQHVTRQQYDAWNKGYSEYLARRRKKWIAYMKESGMMTDRPTRFPAMNAKTRRFVRKGIPPDWRGAAWFYYAGGPAILAKHGGLYDKLLQRRARRVDADAIERDLHRTFPDNIKFKPPMGQDMSSESDHSTLRYSSSSSSAAAEGVDGEPAIISSLRRVLHAFAIYNPSIGYCQSLNFLGGLLLLFVETEEQVFWLLNVITCLYLPGTHDTSLEGSKVDLGVLMTEIRDTMPSVWDKIGGELDGEPSSTRPQTSRSLRRARPSRSRGKGNTNVSTERLPPITLCMTAWFMSCFIGTLPIETTLRVWDVFFYDGSKTLFRIALAIFKCGESEIKAVKDPMEMFGVVQSMPRRMLDANALMEACFKRRNGFGHLSQADIDDRRQQRREQARQDIEARRARGKTIGGGTITELESEAEVQRTGTLFGRK